MRMQQSSSTPALHRLVLCAVLLIATAISAQPLQAAADDVFPAQRVWLMADGTRVRFAAAGLATDDNDAYGKPEIVEATLSGLEQARALLVDRLELEPPRSLEVVYGRLLHGSGGGFVAPKVRGRTAIMLDASPGAEYDSVRRAAIDQYARVLAQSNGRPLPVAWARALGLWANLQIDGSAEPAITEAISRRLTHLADGMFAGGTDAAAGHALWLDFIGENYGPAAVRLTVQELATGGLVVDALDRAIRRSSSDDLVAAFREFHVWAVLTGDRSDGRHFSFAENLSSPRFASSNDGLPSLSVRVDPAIAPWGATQVQFRPRLRDGGFRIHFEGEFTASWQADLLMFGADGSKRRIAFDLGPEGRAEATVPAGGLDEAILLVRNVGSEDGASRGYTYAAHHERGFPFEMASIAAEPDEQGVAIRWETISEQSLVAFNVLRRREDAEQTEVVNAVWIPALGELSDSTSYRYVDLSAEPGVAYVYSVQGLTRDGMSARSEPMIVRVPDEHDRRR